MPGSASVSPEAPSGPRPPLNSPMRSLSDLASRPLFSPDEPHSDAAQAQVLTIPDKYTDPDVLLNPPIKTTSAASKGLRGPRSRVNSSASAKSSSSLPFRPLPFPGENMNGMSMSPSDVETGIGGPHSLLPTPEWMPLDYFDIPPRDGQAASNARDEHEDVPLLPLNPNRPAPSRATSFQSLLGLQKTSPFRFPSPESSPGPETYTVVFEANGEEQITTSPFLSDITTPRTGSSAPSMYTPQNAIFDSPTSASGLLRKSSRRSSGYTSPPSTPGTADKLEYNLYPRTSTYSSAPSTRKHPFGPRFSSFEEPQWRSFGYHVALCVFAYPFLMIFVVISRDKSLWWSRIFVGLGCGILGLSLGVSLLRLSRPIIEAATWATIIHQSRVPAGTGVKLKDLAAHSDNYTSPMAAMRLIWDRHQYPGASRRHRKNYDRRPWSIFIILFLANVCLAGMLPFLFGRVIDIQVRIAHQYLTYFEVPVKADLSDADLERAADLVPAFENNALTWTLAPFSLHGGLPPVVSFPLPTTLGTSYSNYSSYKSTSPKSRSAPNEDEAELSMVYFSEVVQSQLLPDGSGFGTFKTDTTAPTTNLTGVGVAQKGGKQEDGADAEPAIELEPGSILRFPRWGIRIKCAKIPNAQTTVVPKSESNLTYLLTPRETIRPLFTAFQMPFPNSLEQELNVTDLLVPNDTLPGALDVSQMALGAKFWDNGVAHSIKSTPLSMGADGKGFVTLENVLVRMNTSYAPNGTFARLSTDTIPDKDGKPSAIGFDAIVCLELYEPWVVEVYNSSVGVPSSMRIAGAGPTVKDIEYGADFGRERRKGKPLYGVKTSLNSSAYRNVYVASHQNSVNQILKDNGRDAFYVPSPTLVSFTDGQGPFGYTELSENHYAKARALSDASNVLPYFSGSGSSLARLYPDREVTSSKLSVGLFVGVMCTVFVLGAITAFFVPRLPLDTPRRGFDLYSWMTAFAANELVSDRMSGLGRQMDLDDIVENAGETRLRYVLQ